MISWNEYKNITPPEHIFTGRELTDVACPKCGKPLYRRTDIVLTSYPAQYQYECECGWVGYAYQ